MFKEGTAIFWNILQEFGLQNSFNLILMGMLASCFQLQTENHKNELITALTDVSPVARRLKRHWTEDLLK
jgi:hypothetical protein